MLGALLGCAGKPPPAPPRVPAGPAAEGGEIRVTLAWSQPVDLDLYVTDPAQETVYFANASTGSGGKLERDVVCGGIPAGKTEAALSEAIRWDRPPRGRYRVGVDFMDGCESSAQEVMYRVAVDVGGRRKEQLGKIAKGRFESVVFEFDVPGEPEDSRAAR